MKTSIRNKKGFTIVELVIVIAVIAILAAVLIPTFANLVEKANQSADIQACHQMNTQLAIAHAESPIDNIGDAIIALDKANIDLDNYKPLTADRYFYYVNDKNGTPTVIYTDEKDNVIYPEGFDITDLQLMSLSGEIPTDGTYVIKDNAVTITSGAQLAHLMQTMPDTDLTITLSGDIDLKGCAAGFGHVTNKITLQGSSDENRAKLHGIREDFNALDGTWNGYEKDYGFAIFGCVGEEKKSADVTIKNIDISDVVVRSTGERQSGHAAVLVGSLQNGKVEVQNVTIDNCSVYGGDKVGSVIGFMATASCKAELKNVKVTNTKVYGAGYAAKVAGALSPLAAIGFENCDFDGVTTGINRDSNTFNDLWTTGTERDKNWQGADITPDDTYVISENDNVTITGSFIDKKNSKTYTFKKENFKAVGNCYLLYNPNETFGAYTDDYYWVLSIGTSVTINNTETTINLSSSKNSSENEIKVSDTTSTQG